MGDGIDNFGSTCLHENAHMSYFLTTWSTWGNYLSKQATEDIDADLVKDADEPNLSGVNGLPYLPTTNDTNNDTYDDEEDRACTYENGWQVGSSDDEDWAFPGHQW